MKLAVILPLAVLATTSLSAQVIKFDPFAPKESGCGPIAIRAQMIDASDMRMPSQRVKITLTNLSSKPIVLERYTLHFRQATPTSRDRFGTEARVGVRPKQETVFAQMTTATDPVSYVSFDSVKYADGSSWQPSADEACKVVPETLKN